MYGFISRRLGWSKVQTQEAVPTQGDPESKIHLVSFKPYLTMHSSGTPFGAKIEIMLRLVELPYFAHNGDVQDKKVAPKSKMPVLFHGENVVPDSCAIVEYMHNTYPSQMNIFTPSDPVSAATARIAQVMLEEHTHFCMLYLNWQRDETCAKYGPVLLADIPPALRSVLMPMIRGTVLRDLQGRGTGRHSNDEVVAKLARDFDACEALLQKSGAYLSGPTPTAADCMLFGILDMCKCAEAVFQSPDSTLPPYVALAKERPGLMAFYGRLKDKVFPDGPSTNWSTSNWDPSQDPDAYVSSDDNIAPPSKPVDVAGVASASAST